MYEKSIIFLYASNEHVDIISLKSINYNNWKGNEIERNLTKHILIHWKRKTKKISKNEEIDQIHKLENST